VVDETDCWCWKVGGGENDERSTFAGHHKLMFIIEAILTHCNIFGGFGGHLQLVWFGESFACMLETGKGAQLSHAAMDYLGWASRPNQ